MAQKSIITPKWRLKTIIDMLTLEEPLDKLLEEHGFDVPSPAAIAQWRKRNSAPGGWAIAILMIAQERGVLGQISQMRFPRA